MSPEPDLSDDDYVFISYYLFLYIIEHGGILYGKKFRDEFKVSKWKYMKALDLLLKRGIIKKGKGRRVKLSKPVRINI